MKKLSLIILLFVIFSLVILYFFFVERKGDKENFSFDDFCDDIGEGFSDAGDFVKNGFEGIGDAFEWFGPILGNSLEKALHVIENKTAAVAMPTFNAMGSIGANSSRGGVANVVVDEIVKTAYITALLIAGVEVSPMTGFGLISVAESPYNILNPTNNFHNSPSDGVGVPGSPEYVLNSGLNLFV